MAIALVETGTLLAEVIAEVVLKMAIALVEMLADADAVPAEVSERGLPVDRLLSDVLPLTGGGAKE